MVHFCFEHIYAFLFYMKMENTLKLSFPFPGEEKADMLIAALSDIGFTGFETTGSVLDAYIPEKEFILPLFQEVCVRYGVTATSTTIPYTNWNAIWESGFEPVQVGDFCLIRAGFHQPVLQTRHEIIITPKMSFGTGHHATTFMMVQLMQEIIFQDKTVCDLGTGTGVLAILAEKMGATSVLAIDNDAQCMENAAENCTVNQCTRVQLEKNDRLPTGRWDVILANINLNVLCDNMPLFAASLTPKGQLLLSGILETDIGQISEIMHRHGLNPKKILRKNGWAAIAAARFPVY
jgi:ribosomal protein L11 methyltransferase